MNKLIQGDCFELIKQLPDNYIDLIITSPPYANLKSYGKKVNIFHPDNYVEWFLPLQNEFNRVLKPSGSFILNIGSACVKKQRHIYVHELICRTVKETNLKFYDEYFWHKLPPTLPNCGSTGKRLNNTVEYLLHFCKDQNKIKWNMDDVREEHAEATKKRAKLPYVLKYKVNEKGEKVRIKNVSYKLNKKGKVPENVFRFRNVNRKKNTHPAPFDEELPLWFIKALTDEDDIVLDPFIGSGTTATAAIESKRNWIGFELNTDYIEIANKKIKNTMGVNNFFNV